MSKTISKQKTVGFSKTEVNEELRRLVSPHIDSFNFALGPGFKLATDHLLPYYHPHPGFKSKLYLENFQIHRPTEGHEPLYPFQCRQEYRTYEGKITADLIYQRLNGNTPIRIQQMEIGSFPVMLCTQICNLHGLKPTDLVRRKEEPEEFGGYFVVNGNEKLMRMLIVSRRNEVLAVNRGSFVKLGTGYSTQAVMIRCVRSDQLSRTVTMHRRADGSCFLRLIMMRSEYLLPIIPLLKALVPTTDREIYEKVTEGNINNTFMSDAIEMLLRESKKTLKLFTREQCLSYFGVAFKSYIEFLPPNLSAKDVGAILIERNVLIHLNSNREKFDLIIFMLQKLFSFVGGTCCEDSTDTPNNMELLLPGHLLLNVMQEQMQYSLKRAFVTLTAEEQEKFANEPNEKSLRLFFERSNRLSTVLRSLLSTGNLQSVSGLDLMQKSSFAIIAEKLNYIRFIAHFRSVHRGAFFAEMKTTSPRKLMPESWGFFCPVHTPDGAPCGLLNHLARPCEVVNRLLDNSVIPEILVSLGMEPISSSFNNSKNLTVVVDGRVVGKINPQRAVAIVEHLRALKCKTFASDKKKRSKAEGKAPFNGVPAETETMLILPSTNGRFPGLFIATTPTRMVRPVKNLKTGQIELIGIAEQIHMNIACLDEDVRADTTHQEITPTNILSVVADLTPFSDFNQSPRNMYQCQMAKQTIGTAMHSYDVRSDNKVYRILTPQQPIVRNDAQLLYGINEYPHGTNAIVAVISYTGYDMEDAMIINKSSFERGFGHGTIYKSDPIDLNPPGHRRDAEKVYFCNRTPEGKLHVEGLDEDGLPFPGSTLEVGRPYYCTYNPETHKFDVTNYKGETCLVDQVRVVGRGGKGNDVITHAIIKLRLDRMPVIGDKFASRHGQKGILSQLWPEVNMPFSESGMTPDVIINPHAFPSRMTIGMLVESMAGKSGAMHGIYQNSTPFSFDEENRAVDYFGEELVKAGYNYYGNEPMYSGVNGTVFNADIYLGVVYYQRLRHMVKDKYQVRALGPNHALTHQPIKGRKKGGGIRFGEMERDSLIAHGCSFLLHDRLMLSSDGEKTCYCKQCGSIIAASTIKEQFSSFQHMWKCLNCDDSKHIETVEIPYVFKYLATELAAVNIKLTLSSK
eukprot:TRINITY_DN2573_c0_g1_i3.p1 TRINITY_DN2573_c0_g1~~TRINITY_DN2573_c0_g1_i3.p1  ORF type:complete len:1133 (+),score=312.71 TRINITY_DN2573_c0_g1_i3:209-3607(+)